ncbi:MAG TPA: twin-arginine translocase TatA/TatE family subunit [Acidobacteriaceae bacterium]
MHLGDSIFIFILALVLFGPKKLPEMAKQIGKLMAEFRRASNDFRMQIDEELRTMERQEQQQKQEAERAQPSILPPQVQPELAAGASLQIMAPAQGEPVPYAVSAEPEQQAEDHPLLHVQQIPAYGDGTEPTGLAAAEANAARLGQPPAADDRLPEHLGEAEQAPVHHG